MDASHRRWPRATSEHERPIKQMLLDAVESSPHRTLPGGVNARDISTLPLYDMLDLADDLVKKHGMTQFEELLSRVRAPHPPTAS